MSINVNSTATSFEDLQTAVLETFKRDDKQTELERAINDTNKEMVACVDPRKMKDQIYKPTVVGREEYAIPDTILRINHPIRLIDPTASNNQSSSFPLRFRNKDEYDELEPNPNASTIVPGVPSDYTFYKNSILLTPIPDRVYRLEMNVGGEATLLVEASDTTIFAPTWDETIKAGALARLYLGIQDKESAAAWQAVYRFGFAGNEKNITGGLELLKQLNEQIEKAPLISKPTYF